MLAIVLELQNETENEIGDGKRSISSNDACKKDARQQILN